MFCAFYEYDLLYVGLLAVRLTMFSSSSHWVLLAFIARCWGWGWPTQDTFYRSAASKLSIFLQKSQVS